MEFDAPLAEDGTRDATEIWRYMDLPRSVSLLSTGRLWFAKAATLRDDPWEGFGVDRHWSFLSKRAPVPRI